MRTFEDRDMVWALNYIMVSREARARLGRCVEEQRTFFINQYMGTTFKCTAEEAQLLSAALALLGFDNA